MSDEEKINELAERIRRIAQKEIEVDARMRKIEQILIKKTKE